MISYLKSLTLRQRANGILGLTAVCTVLFL